MANLIEFEPVDDNRTRITSWGLGYGAGDAWDQMIGFFIAGNEWSYNQLGRALAGENIRPACEREEN